MIQLQICNKLLYAAFLFLFCFLSPERSGGSVQLETSRVRLLAGRERFLLVVINSYPLSVLFSCYASVHPLIFLKVPLLFLILYFHILFKAKSTLQFLSLKAIDFRLYINLSKFNYYGSIQS